jgi:hypothetical protein
VVCCNGRVAKEDVNASISNTQQGFTTSTSVMVRAS